MNVSRSGYERRDYGRGTSTYAPPRRENQPMTREQLERRVYCHNLSYRSSWQVNPSGFQISCHIISLQDLKDYMRQAGDVEHVRIMEDSEGRSRVCLVRSPWLPWSHMADHSIHICCCTVFCI